MKRKLILVGAMLVVGTKIFAQQEKETPIEEVTIASKSPQQLYKTGKNVKLLSEKDLEKYQGQNLTDVLDQVAGFQITGNFNSSTEPKSIKIRGGKSSNVMILLDGIPLKDVTGNDYNVSDLRLIALENIESIEVLNGASSVLYGSNATVSVINIKTKKNTNKVVEGILSARGGSFSTFAQDASILGKFKNFNYQISGFNEKSEGISSAEGNDTFDKDGWEKQNVSAKLGYSTEKFNVNINGGWNHNLHKYDGGAFTDSNNRGNDKQYYVGGNANFKYNKGNLVFNLRYTNTNRLAQDIVNQSYQDQYQYKGDNFFAELYNVYTINKFIDVTAGLQYEKQSMAYLEKPWGGENMEEVFNFDQTNITLFDAYVNANFKYNVFHLDTGTRITNHSKFGNNWVYSINPYYLQEFSDLYLKAGYSYATAFIAPTLYQNFGSLPWTAPNFDLKPETNRSHEIDLSFGKKDRSLNINASFFFRKEKDVFAYMLVDPVNYVSQFQNVDQNKVKGFEVGFDYTFNRYAKIGGNFSYVEKDKEATMLRQPKQRINSYLEILPCKSTRISFSHQFVGKRTDAYYDSSIFATKNVEVENFHIFNLNINQKITHKIDTYLNIGNLFNRSYIDVIGYTTKPRNYTLGVSYKF
ncbi:TonB-dependent receptor plug domain-containing protein [Chryseobacterium oryctis]|uniref:TonB-dependent receptor n=1 Tax=Chryseobacterium oryctis TaxID=2952618 RepID=A0ABT3HJH5_9FLAO|nr:TonB-dependent receptor [Chryseobacterium oryctis]MCW3159790.1 TonB-dependent receptor [Chryseobacterium oryctis]